MPREIAVPRKLIINSIIVPQQRGKGRKKDGGPGGLQDMGGASVPQDNRMRHNIAFIIDIGNDPTADYFAPYFIIGFFSNAHHRDGKVTDASRTRAYVALFPLRCHD
jgi:hypothetical protein